MAAVIHLAEAFGLLLGTLAVLVGFLFWFMLRSGSGDD
jgi:hypothetical protein